MRKTISFLSIILCLALCFSLLPVSAMADPEPAEIDFPEGDGAVVAALDDEVLSSAVFENTLFSGYPTDSASGLDGSVIEIGEGGLDTVLDPSEFSASFSEELDPVDEVSDFAAGEDPEAGVAAGIVGTQTDGLSMEDRISVSESGDALSAVGDPDGLEGLPEPGAEQLDGASRPTGYYMRISSTKCAVNGSITLYSNFTNTTSAYLAIKNRSTNRITWYAVRSGTTYRLTFNSVGNFALYLKLYNRYGSFDGSTHNGTLYVTAGQSPQAYYMSISKTAASIGDTVTLRFDRKNASRATLYVKNSGGGTVYSADVGTSLSLRINAAGRYSFYLVTRNDYGSYDGSRNNQILYCTVTNPAPGRYAWNLTSAARIDQNGSATIRVTDMGGATQATVVTEQGGKVISQCSFGAPTTITFKPHGNTGTFVFYLITKNSGGTYNGKLSGQTITVTVTGGKPSDYWMSVSKSSCYVGDTLQFSVDPKNSSSYYFVIEKDGTAYYCKNHGLSKALSFTPSASGNYLFYLITYNAYGSFNGKSNGYTLSCRVDKRPRVYDVNTDGYSFDHTPANLGYSSGDKVSLDSYQQVFGIPIGYLKWLFSDAWGGSCFGLASTSAAAFQYPGDNFAGRYGASTVYGLAAPKDKTAALTKVLERYQLSQGLSAVSGEKNKNEKNIRSLISAVESFESGGPPVIIGVYRDGGGHAVVPLEHYESGLKHYFRVYDCNCPGTVQTMTITTTSGGSYYSMVYDNGLRRYNRSFDFIYADTVRNALPSRARSNMAALLADGSEEELLLLVLSGAENAVCTRDGTLVDLEQYLVRMCDADTESGSYYLPAGEYEISCTSGEAVKMSCAVSDGVASALAETGDTLAATFTVSLKDGVMQCAAKTVDRGQVNILLIDGAGRLSRLDAVGASLGVELDMTSSEGIRMRASGDAAEIERNGDTLQLADKGTGFIDGVALVSETVAAFGGFGAEDGKLSAEGKTARLSFAENRLVGTLTLATENPGGLAEFPVYVACYDAEGRMIGAEYTRTVIGAGQGAATVELKGAIQPNALQSGAWAVKVFLVGDGSIPLCEAAEFSGVTIME